MSTTYITSTLTTLSAELASWTRSRDGSRERRVRLLAVVLTAYGLGALVGGVLQSRASTLLIWLPPISVVAVVVNAFLRHRHAPLEPEPRDDGRSPWAAARRSPGP